MVMEMVAAAVSSVCVLAVVGISSSSRDCARLSPE